MRRWSVTFHRQYAFGCCVMPNPWDVGSARSLEQMGFKALATTSAGLAWTLGRADNRITLDQVLEHLREIVSVVKVPVNADFEGGFLDAAREIAEDGTFSCFNRLPNVDALFRER
jgi:2-methylisocitrate lyase-like PEP mutase family enzyme